MQPRVFCSQIPSKLSQAADGTKVWIPNVDLSSTSEFGEIVELAGANSNWLPTDKLAFTIISAMHREKFCYSDYLLLLGSPQAVAITSVRAAKIIAPSPIRLLVWDRITRRYSVHLIPTDPHAAIQCA